MYKLKSVKIKLSFIGQASSFIALGACALLFQNCDFANGVGTKIKLGTQASSPSLGTVEDTIPAAKPSSAVSSVPIIADRYYIISLFDEIFGPTWSAVDSSKLLTDGPNLGSPCSIYEDYRRKDPVKGWIQADPAAACDGGSVSFLNGVTNPSATVTRQALITHACSDLIANSVTFHYALAQISSVGPPAGTRDNVLKAFRLFYRYQADPTESLLTSLTANINASAPTEDDWKSTLFIICSSSYWQEL